MSRYLLDSEAKMVLMQHDEQFGTDYLERCSVLAAHAIQSPVSAQRAMRKVIHGMVNLCREVAAASDFRDDAYEPVCAEEE